MFNYFVKTVSAAGAPTECNPSSGVICNPLAGNENLIDFINSLIAVIVQLGAILCVLAIIYAGYMFVTAAGDEKKITTAKQAFLYAMIGTAILLGASVISYGIQGTINSL